MKNHLQPYHFISQNTQNFIAELSTFIRFPSVNAQTLHTKDIANCTHWLATHLTKISLNHVQIIPTKKHPMVYADWLHAPGKLTLLFMATMMCSLQTH